MDLLDSVSIIQNTLSKCSFTRIDVSGDTNVTQCSELVIVGALGSKGTDTDG